MKDLVRSEKVEIGTTHWAYHLNKIAITQCRSFPRSICDEDRKTLNESTFEFLRFYVFCINCYAIRLPKEASSFNFGSVIAIASYICFI